MAGARPHPTSWTFVGRHPERGGWRALDALVPHTQATRRVRACALVAAIAITVSSLADVMRGPAGGGTSTARPRSTIPAPAPPAPPLAPRPPGAPAPIITRVETADPVVFITIDDGHSRSPQTAAAFAELAVPATLFLIDDPVRRGAAFFRGLPGTVVEGHTQHHPDLRTVPESRQVEEICGNADLIAATFGRRPTLFRPPYGNYNAATRRAAAACGMAAVVLWSVTVDEGRIRFRYEPGLRRGDIVLLHFRPGLAEDLRTVVRHAEEAGLRVALLEDYLVPGREAGAGATKRSAPG